MTQSKATRGIVDTHRHIFGPKTQKLVENIGFEDAKPLPQVFGDEMFSYRESVDVDYSRNHRRPSSEGGSQSCENGKFTWIMDPGDNKIELWEARIWDDRD